MSYTLKIINELPLFPYNPKETFSSIDEIINFLLDIIDNEPIINDKRFYLLSFLKLYYLLNSNNLPDSDFLLLEDLFTLALDNDEALIKFINSSSFDMFFKFFNTCFCLIDINM